MPAALPIREDLSASELRAPARREGKGRVAARLFAIARRHSRGRHQYPRLEYPATHPLRSFAAVVTTG